MQSHWWGDLRLDLRQSLRLLAKDRAFTASALITLALGIGANIAIFSVINAALLRPLPFDHPERILFIQTTDPRTGDPIPVSAGDYNDFRDRTQTCEAVGLIRYRENLSLSLGKEAESITVHLATSSVFQAFGVSPVIGRLFTPEEERMGGDQAILLSYGAWQTRFGGRREIVGSRVSVGGAPGDRKRSRFGPRSARAGAVCCARCLPRACCSPSPAAWPVSLWPTGRCRRSRGCCLQTCRAAIRSRSTR